MSNRIKWILAVCAISLGSSLLIIALYTYPGARPFLTTNSPGGTYTVELTGQKERPFWFTAEVHFNVLKNGKPFWTNQYLHSGDAFDLSFEVGYPDHRWLAENFLQFYREENFSEGLPSKGILMNESNQAIKHLKIEGEDKFLVFDLLPNSAMTFYECPPKGDYPGVRVSGEFYDGRILESTVVFAVKGIKEPLIYSIYIRDDTLKIESPHIRN